MSWTQTTAINTAAQDNAGMCLRFAQKVFSTKPYGYESAWIAWEATQVKHYDRNFPNVATPVWFSHMGTYGGVYKNWGHVVAWIPGAGFLSSPGSGYGQQWFGSIEEIERYFRCTFVGWSEDINDLDVMDWNDDGGDVPPVPAVRTYTVIPGDTLWGIATMYYGDGSRYPEIAAANGIENPNLIFPGQTFIIP
jgi:nucleoid-associated protein YgaU